MKDRVYIIKVMVFCFLFIGFFRTNAQTLGQDAEGYSSIVVPAVTFNLDISSSTVAVFSINKEFAKKDIPIVLGDSCEKYYKKGGALRAKDVDCLSRSFKSEFNKRAWLLGADVKGGIKDGLGTIFSGEKVASSASVSGLIGWKRSWTSLRNSGAKKIIIARDTSDNQESRIKTIKDRITKELQEIVMIQTGCSMCIGEPKTLKKVDEYIAFYKGRLESLNDYGKTANESKENKEKEYLKEKQKRLIEIKNLDSLIDTGVKNLENFYKLKDVLVELEKLEKNFLSETDKKKKEGIGQQIARIRNFIANNSEETLRNEIYKDFLFLKPKLEKKYPNYQFTEPFNQTNWNTTSDKVKKDLETAIAEKSYIEKITVAKDETEEMKELKKNYIKLIKEYESQKDINKELDDLNSTIAKKSSLSTFLLYLRPSVKGEAYKYDLANDSTLVADRFVDRKFNGYTVELGSTLNFNKYHFMGLSTSVNYTNNISALTTTTYKLEKQDTSITDGKFTTSEEIKALSGAFDAYMRYDLNFDYVYLMSMKESSDSEKTSAIYLSINPYLRHRIYDKSDKLKNNTILGLGLHAYNSNDNKLMGGLFVQTTDLFGVHAGDDSSLGKRIVFGIIAKYNITGLKLEKK